MKNLKELLSSEIKKKFKLKNKKINDTEKYKIFSVLLNDTLREEDFKEYLNLTFLKELRKIENLKEYKYFSLNVRRIKKDVFNYNERENQVYKANIYRITLKITKDK